MAYGVAWRGVGWLGVGWGGVGWGGVGWGGGTEGRMDLGPFLVHKFLGSPLLSLIVSLAPQVSLPLGCRTRVVPVSRLQPFGLQVAACACSGGARVF